MSQPINPQGNIFYGRDGQAIDVGEKIKRVPHDLVFDVVVRTQAEFETLYNSPNWLGAVSVAFVGEIIKYGGELLIPQTVKRIQGFNSATIYFSNPSGGLGYASTSTSDCSISDLTVRFTVGSSSSVGNLLWGFRNCCNLINCSFNCRADVFAPSDIITRCRGFLGCTNLINCKSSCLNTGAFYNETLGFCECNNLINCVSNCLSSNTDADYNYGFYRCTRLTNCVVERAESAGIGTKVGYGFSFCSFANNCVRTGVTTTAIWDMGTCYKIDTESCQMNGEEN